MKDATVLLKAIAAHAGWKSRLKIALINGKLDVPPDQIKADNVCDFGKFLYGPDLTAEEKSSEHYKSVKRLHAAFHLEAAQVADWCVSHQQGKAEQSMALGGNFAMASSSLTEAVTVWNQSIHQ